MGVDAQVRQGASWVSMTGRLPASLSHIYGEVNSCQLIRINERGVDASYRFISSFGECHNYING